LSTEERGYITFPALTQVLKAEKYLAGQNIKFTIVPIPREISADCGMCIMCPPESIAPVTYLLAGQNIEFENTYVLKKKKLSFF